jgi:membrane protease YdiL (CAAX protease family)
LLLYVLAVSGRFEQVGFSFEINARDLSIITTNVVFAAVIIVPIGMAGNFLVPGWAGTPPLAAAAQFLAIFVFVALPEEILFRGAIHAYLGDSLRLGFNATLLLSSLIFGAAHLNNSPSPGWYFVLATIAGVFYARAFVFSRRTPAAGWVHTSLNWLWAIAFRAP